MIFFGVIAILVVLKFRFKNCLRIKSFERRISNSQSIVDKKLKQFSYHLSPTVLESVFKVYQHPIELINFTEATQGPHKIEL